MEEKGSVMRQRHRIVQPRMVRVTRGLPPTKSATLAPPPRWLDTKKSNPAVTYPALELLKPYKKTKPQLD
jgi:hypothetical protein